MAVNPSIEKKILCGGKGPLPTYKEGTKFTFHFKTVLCDGSNVVLDDSREWTEPMHIIFGKNFKLEVWEMCLKTMLEGEVCSFVVKKNLTYAYPQVLKTLRDNFRKDAGKRKNHGHMCGMMAMQAQGGLGYDDLNKLMNEPQPLEFIIELIKVEQKAEYEEEAWMMSKTEKLKSVPILKEEGNRLFKEKYHKQAEEKYSEAIGRLESLMLHERQQDPEWHKLNNLKIPLLLNFSQCKLLSKDYYAVIEHCSEILEHDKDNEKAIYRRAKAHAGLCNFDEARDDFSTALRLCPDLKKNIEFELKSLDQVQKKTDCEEKEKMKKLFE